MKDLGKEVLKHAIKERKGEYNYVPLSQTEEEKRKNLSPRIRLENLREVTRLLNPFENQMLEFLIINGNVIPSCVYNKEGHIVNLTIEIKSSIPEFICFPHLKELWSSYKLERDIDFVHRHHSSVKILKLIGQGLIKIPDLSDFHKLKVLNLSTNKLHNVNKFGELLNLKVIEIINSELKSVEGFREINGCPNIEEICIRHNQISDVCGFEPFSHFNNLQYIDLSYNNLKDFFVSNELNSLNAIELVSNPIESVIGLEKIPNLNYLGPFSLKRLSNENVEHLYRDVRELQLIYTIDNDNNLRIKKPQVNNADFLNFCKIDPRSEVGLKKRESIKGTDLEFPNLTILQKRIIFVLGKLDYKDVLNNISKNNYTSKSIINYLDSLYRNHNIPNYFRISVFSSVNDLVRKGIVCSELLNDHLNRKKKHYSLTELGDFWYQRLKGLENNLFKGH